MRQGWQRIKIAPRVQAIKASPGDILIFSYPGALSEEATRVLKSQADARTGCVCMFLEEGIQLSQVINMSHPAQTVAQKPKPTRRPMIRARHAASFRPGEWAAIVGVEVHTPTGLNSPRVCFVVEFRDGVRDYWPVENVTHEYEFSPSCPY